MSKQPEAVLECGSYITVTAETIMVWQRLYGDKVNIRVAGKELTIGLPKADFVATVELGTAKQSKTEVTQPPITPAPVEKPEQTQAAPAEATILGGCTGRCAECMCIKEGDERTGNCIDCGAPVHLCVCKGEENEPEGNDRSGEGDKAEVGETDGGQQADAFDSEQTPKVEG